MTTEQAEIVLHRIATYDQIVSGMKQGLQSNNRVNERIHEIVAEMMG